jgi:hypothetical protein
MTGTPDISGWQRVPREGAGGAGDGVLQGRAKRAADRAPWPRAPVSPMRPADIERDKGVGRSSSATATGSRRWMAATGLLPMRGGGEVPGAWACARTGCSTGMDRGGDTGQLARPQRPAGSDRGPPGLFWTAHPAGSGLVSKRGARGYPLRWPARAHSASLVQRRFTPDVSHRHGALCWTGVRKRTSPAVTESCYRAAIVRPMRYPNVRAGPSVMPAPG